MSELNMAAPEVKAQPLTEVELLAREILLAREKNLASKIGRADKRDRVWFGDVHDCDRHNVYSMIEGDQRTRWDVFVQAKLDAGREWEQITKRELAALGYEPLLAGEIIEIKNRKGDIIARGRTDCSLKRINGDHRGKVFICEMKQMQTHAWDAINKWQDLLRSPWYKKYVRQLMLYMYAKGTDEGLFHLGDFQGHWKLIPVHLDWDIVEDSLSKIERATQAKEDNVLPDRIPFDNTLCGRCQFAAVCIPDIKSIGIEQIGNETTAALLERRDALKEKASEYAKLDKSIRELFKDIKDGVFTIGNFIVTRTGITKKKYEIPEEVKDKFIVSAIEYRNKIERFSQPDPETIWLEPKRIFDLEDL